jgi:hypothetical protein
MIWRFKVFKEKEIVKISSLPRKYSCSSKYKGAKMEYNMYLLATV